ncbi:methenyltetrahydromethanopterin cyclohydrolase [Azospirillum halopraeferens]|uniref:methenyltetrahydromethanopterin cyclohydrolase n=1 Tax=Azospirillum halopraeferens TaxID=34010 RepID=UPI0004099A4A|nr:methenyltetrahydromethanopterin cyclohydrolase [Azospirillum halopraeferens]
MSPAPPAPDARPADGRPGVARRAVPLVEALVADADALRLGVSRGPSGATLVDGGIAVPGGLEAGRRIAEICMGGLGSVALVPADGPVPFRVAVTAADPVLACLASQYAGLSLTHGEGDGAWGALGSGPGRAQAAREDLFAELGYRDRADRAVFVLETDRPPPPELCVEVAGMCGVAPDALTMILTPTRSLAGTVQIVARVLEVALHKAHTLHFPPERIIDGAAWAPLPPPGADFLDAMGRTNDAILYGGTVHLFVDGPEEEAEALARGMPSAASRDFGRPFAELFAAVNFDFYAIDGHLFSPAAVAVTALATGRTFRAGAVRPDLLARSFGLSDG